MSDHEPRGGPPFATSPAESFRVLFQRHPLPMWLYDRDTLAFVVVNDAALRQYGWSEAEFLAMTIADIRPPEDVPRLKALLAQQPAAAASPFAFRRTPGWRHNRKDGSTLLVDIYSQEFPFHGHRLQLIAAHEVTQLVEAIDRVAQRDAQHGDHRSDLFAHLFQSSSEAIVLIDERDAVLDANPAFEALFGFALAELRGRTLVEVIVPPDQMTEALELTRRVLAREPVRVETRRMRKDGVSVPVSIIGYPIIIEDRQVGVFGIYRDLTELQELASRLMHESTHDRLTGLHNRDELERRVAEAVADARAGGQHALLQVDLQQFSALNARHGREAGDAVLRKVAAILAEHVGPQDQLARLGSDEFGLLLRGVDPEQAQMVAARLVGAVAARPIEHKGAALRPTLSVGVMPIGRDTGTLQSALDGAEMAARVAGGMGRDSVYRYSDDDRTLKRLRDEMEWVSRLQELIAEQRFELYHQRIVPLTPDPSHLAHYEILLRVEDGLGGVATPARFAMAAERHKLMPTIDRAVITRALAKLGARGPQAPRELVSLNLSGTTVNSRDIADFIESELARHKVAAERVCFEITETAAIADLTGASGFVGRVRELGCHVALDDFGVGMASFGYLRDLDVDYLKIDGAFIRELVSNPLDEAMTEAINRIAHAKGIKTVAEFVEDERTRDQLKRIGVDYAQGYFIHRPEPWLPEAG